MGKRYLIVLDDLWDGMAWDELSRCFPDVGNRSRIVVTTRLEKVGEHVKCYTDLYFLPFLKPDESLKLLQKKVFEQESCAPALQAPSQAVAERCKRLPLVVVLVAGIIKRNKTEASWWDEVKNSLFSYLGESQGYSLSTMQLSYDNLPDYLKPCLLYMGMFPNDTRIPVSKLISLCIAEDFVENIESGRLMEEAAEGYLMELIRNNVVMVSKREYNGQMFLNLQELEIAFTRDGSDSSDEEGEQLFLNLESYTQLQMLSLFVDKPFTVSKLYLPSNLKKLVLRADIEECAISIIAGLPSLEYLQLKDANYFRYRKWCLEDITFHKLKLLKLVNLSC